LFLSISHHFKTNVCKNVVITACTPHLKTVNDTILFFSNEMTTATIAANHCAAIGGGIITTVDDMINGTFFSGLEFYTAGLANISRKLDWNRLKNP